MKRREFIRLASAAGAATGVGMLAYPGSASASKAQVVVVGGGFGGVIAAKYIKLADPSISVTLIEANKNYTTCPGSNWVVGGLRGIDAITHSYDNLAKKHGVKVVHDMVTGIDAKKRVVKTKGGHSIGYDRCIVSPGIDFKWDAIEGLSEKDSHGNVPHAWKAGPQTTLLRKQLEAMPDGGTFVIVPPPNPFRCPPGPAERISMVAHYLMNNKPKSKIIAIDSKAKFSKQGLFVEGWKKNYPKGMIEYRHQSKVEEIDAKNKTVIGEVDEVKADVLNVIPAQKAGHIAHVAGLTDKSGWCPVDHKTWESKLHKNIHVIGDAAIASPLPKSGYAANSEAKVCAAAVVALLQGKPVGMPAWTNTCYSLVTPTYGISVAMVYNLTAKGTVGKVKGSGGLSGKNGNRQMEAIYADSWLANISHDMFG